MAKLLHIEASPRKSRSHSIDVAHAFLDAYRASHPDDEVETLDLWSTELPEFDGAIIDAKYRILHGQEHTDEEKAAWQAVVETFETFNAADKYLFSLPMWNFGVPYKLKHWIDVITQPGLAFSFSPETGYTGLVTGKPAVVVYARGGEYTSSGDMQALDHQKGYFDQFLGFIGFTDVKSFLVEPTLNDPEAVNAMKAEVTKSAEEFARSF